MSRHRDREPKTVEEFYEALQQTERICKERNERDEKIKRVAESVAVGFVGINVVVTVIAIAFAVVMTVIASLK